MKEFFNEEAYTVAFVWETGFWETLQQKLETIYKSKGFKTIAKYVSFRSSSRVLKTEINGEVKGTGQPIALDKIEQELQKDNPFDQVEKDNIEKPNQREINSIESQLASEFQTSLAKDPQFADVINKYKRENRRKAVAFLFCKG